MNKKQIMSSYEFHGQTIKNIALMHKEDIPMKNFVGLWEEIFFKYRLMKEKKLKF